MKTKLTLPRLFFFALVILGTVVFFSCKQSGKQMTADGKTLPSVLKFNKKTLLDEKGIGGPVCTYLAPEGWDVDAAIDWNINDVQLPAKAHLKVSKPGEAVAMEGFPDMIFLVTADPDLNDEYPAGSMYYAAKVMNVQPTVLDLIKTEVLPTYRNVQGLKIVEEKELSLEESNHMRAKEFKNTNSRSGVVKIEYEENGTTVEEAVYGTMSLFPVSQTVEYAGLSMCYACKAPKGELKSNMGIFETVLNSVKMNPKWMATFARVTQLAMQQAFGGGGNNSGYAGGNNGGYNGGQMDPGYSGNGTGGWNGNGNAGGTGNFGDLSGYVNQAGSQVDNSIIQSYERQQAGNDRVFESYSDYMRDYQNFTDPNSGDVYKLSSGYSNAWTDNSGSVVMSNDAGYDPNAGGGSSSWTSLSAGGSTVSSSSDGGSGE